MVATALTSRRELRQRKVNELDSHANGRLVDTLLNYETVKVYAREDFERQRYGAVGTEEVVGEKAVDAINVFGPGDTEGA